MPRPPSPTPVPTIACFNRASTPMGVDFDALVAAMQAFLDQHFAPVWATPAKLLRTRGFRRGTWAMVFHDSYSDADTEGYRDVTPEGLPMSRVFVKNILRQKDQVSVAASHELAEMLVDPLANFYTTGPRPNRLYDYEGRRPGRGAVLPGRWHRDNGLRLSRLVRVLPQARLNALRSHADAHAALRTPRRRLPELLERGKGTNAVGLQGQTRPLQAGGPQRPPQPGPSQK